MSNLNPDQFQPLVKDHPGGQVHVNGEYAGRVFLWSGGWLSNVRGQKAEHPTRQEAVGKVVDTHLESKR